MTVPTISLIANVDVPELETAIDFYRDALGLRLRRRLFEGTVADMLGGSSPIYLLANAAGSAAGRPRAARLSTPLDPGAS